MRCFVERCRTVKRRRRVRVACVSERAWRAMLRRGEVVRRRRAGLVAVSSVKAALVVSWRRRRDGSRNGAMVAGRRRRVEPRSHLTRMRVSMVVGRRSGVLVVRSNRQRMGSRCGTSARVVLLCRRLTAAAAIEEGRDRAAFHARPAVGPVECKRGRGLPALRVLRFDVELEGHVDVKRGARRAGGRATCRSGVAGALRAAIGVQKSGERRERCAGCCCWSHDTEIRSDEM